MLPSDVKLKSLLDTGNETQKQGSTLALKQMADEIRSSRLMDPQKVSMSSESLRKRNLTLDVYYV